MISCPIALGAAQNPHAIALIQNQQTFTYLELDQIVSRFCHYLLALPPEMKIAFIAHTHWRCVALLFALFRLGRTACPLSYRLPQLDPALVKLKPCLFINPEEIPLRDSHSTTLWSLDYPATHLFTSGTTSEPKIACHTLGNHYYSALGINSALQFTASDRWLLALPLFHVGGLAILFRAFLAQGAVVISKDISALSQATFASLVPTQLYRLLQEPALGSCPIKWFLLGGAALPDSLYHQAIARGLNICPSYGMTEMSSTIAIDTRKAKEIAYEVLPYRKLTLAADGEILVRGETLFQGYLGEAQNEWLSTRDLGTFTSDGRLKVIGRKDNLFISGGENIQPEEIEQALLSIEGVQRAIVVAIPDQEFGARPAAFVQAPKGFALEKLKEKLPGFKIPKRFFPLEESHDNFKEPRRYFQELALAKCREVPEEEG